MTNNGITTTTMAAREATIAAMAVAAFTIDGPATTATMIRHPAIPAPFASGGMMNRSCYRLADGAPKRCFDSLDEAERHINGGAGMNAYRCPRCDWFHVGHLPGTKFGSKPGGRGSPIRVSPRSDSNANS